MMEPAKNKLVFQSFNYIIYINEKTCYKSCLHACAIRQSAQEITKKVAETAPGGISYQLRNSSDLWQMASVLERLPANSSKVPRIAGSCRDLA
jgi:hypothetical protein